MSAAVQPIEQPRQQPARAAMRVIVRGRIEASRTFNGARFTRVITPAPDAYSRPAVVELRSKSSLGQKGDDINVEAQLGGFTRKPYEVNQDGERLQIVPVEHTLDVVGE